MLMIAPVYAAEIASADIRGSLTSLPEICISFGILIGYVANYFLAKLPLVYGWRTMLGLCLCFASECSMHACVVLKRHFPWRLELV
ncbi:putative polyol transporter 6 [Hordeum vulgare]|nr:putative polyol transporter 6 [Hordeum vulgare]